MPSMIVDDHATALALVHMVDGLMMNTVHRGRSVSRAIASWPPGSISISCSQLVTTSEHEVWEAGDLWKVLMDTSTHDHVEHLAAAADPGGRQATIEGTPGVGSAS